MFLLYIYALSQFPLTTGSFMERELLRILFLGYEPLERPGAVNIAVPCYLTFGLQQIIDVDEKNQILKSNVWLTYQWYDPKFIWDPAQHGNIKELRVNPKKVWKPDILLYNNVQSSFEPSYPALVIVNSSGWMKWMPPGIVSSTCQIDITWFPFDEQNCMLQYGTWTHNAWLIDLRLGGANGTGVEYGYYVENGEWDLISITATWINTTFDCCPEPYFYVQFYVKLRRRTLSYGFNLIIPCLLISLMSLLCFILPAGTDEKLTLGISIFMSLTVFLIMIGDKLPPTSESYPLIGTYFMVSFIIVSLSQVFTVLTLNFHHRTPGTHDMSPTLRLIFLDWLPWLLMMERPGYDIQRGKMVLKDKSCLIYRNKSDQQVSKSLLSNIKGSTLSLFKQIDLYKKVDAGLEFNNNGNKLIPEQVYDEMQCFENAMLAILKQLSKITKTIRESDEEDDVIDDWQFAAMALDRLCLVIFSMLLVFSSCGIIFAAPHISF